MRREHPGLTLGLVGAWCPSLGASGYTLLDRSGLGAHAEITGSTAPWAASGTGLALDCSLASDVATVRQAPWITSVAGAITVSAWVRPSTTGRSDFFGQWLSQGGQQHFLLATGIVASQFGFYVSSGTGGAGANGGAFVTDRWYHVAGRYYAGSIQVFANGVRVATNNTSVAMSTTSTASVLIGASGDSTGSGLVDDLRVYSRALADAEIALLASRRGIGLVPQRQRRANALGPQFSVNVSGTWRSATPWVNVGGTWKTAMPGTRVGGTWK